MGFILADYSRVVPKSGGSEQCFFVLFAAFRNKQGRISVVVVLGYDFLCLRKARSYLEGSKRHF